MRSLPVRLKVVIQSLQPFFEAKPLMAAKEAFKGYVMLRTIAVVTKSGAISRQ